MIALEKKVEASRRHISVNLHLAHDLAFEMKLIQFLIQLITSSSFFLDRLISASTSKPLDPKSRLSDLPLVPMQAWSTSPSFCTQSITLPTFVKAHKSIDSILYFCSTNNSLPYVGFVQVCGANNHLRLQPARAFPLPSLPARPTTNPLNSEPKFYNFSYTTIVSPKFQKSPNAPSHTPQFCLRQH